MHAEVESSGRAVLWKEREIVDTFGTPTDPLDERWFADWNGCRYGMADPQSGVPYLKHVRTAATFLEIQQLNAMCDGMEQHRRVRGSTKAS